MTTSGIISRTSTLSSDAKLWDSGQQKPVIQSNTTFEATELGRAIGFNGVDAHLDFGKNPLFYHPSFVLWADIIPGSKMGLQHIYGHLGRDPEDFWCNAQLSWDAASGAISLRVGEQGVSEVAQTGLITGQRYFIIGRCLNKTLDLWINGQQVNSIVMPRAMRPGSMFGLWAGQREYVRYGERHPFEGKLFECGIGHDTSDLFINQLINGNTVPEPEPEPEPEPNPEPIPDPIPIPSSLSNIWKNAELQALNTLFSLGTIGVYENQTGSSITCRVFIDKGWRDEMSSYDSHAAEKITQISVLQFEVPSPKPKDKVMIGSKQYQILSIDAEDEHMTLLNVKLIQS